MNRIVTIGFVVLVILISLTLFLTSFVSKGISPQSAQPTLIPTTPIDRSGSFSGAQRTHQEILKDKNKGLLPSQQNALNALRSKVPYTSDAFDLDYSPDLDAYIIYQKDPKNTDFKNFLSDNGVLDVYLGGSNSILVSNQPIAVTIRSAKDDLLNDIGHKSTDDEDESSKEPSPVAKSKQEQVLVDSSKTLVSFNFGGPKKKTTSAAGIGQIVFPPNLGGPNGLGYYQMPDPTAGEYVFSPGACPAQRWGQKELIGVIYTVAQAWRAKYPDSVLRVGDLNAVEHKSHKWGVAVDITISNQSAANTGGSRERNVELGKMFVNTGLIKNIWFCDSSVDAEVMSYARANNLSLQQMSCVSGHNDHFHVDITNPHGPESAPGC